MKFKFSLESVFRVRKHQEKLQKQKLAEELSKKKEIDTLRKRVQGRLENYLDNEQGTGAENIHQIRRRGKHVEEVHHLMNKLGDKLQEVEFSVDRERENLAEAHKRRHIMEKMKEFEQASFVEKIIKNEQKNMDEIATQTFSLWKNG